jgi:hypothetical protein
MLVWCDPVAVGLLSETNVVSEEAYASARKKKSGVEAQ